MTRMIRLGMLSLLAAVLGGCGYTTLQTLDEQAAAAWSEVLSQYQRRADLIPGIVTVVKGYAAQESDLFRRVTAARARVSAVQAAPDLLGIPDGLQGFQSAQEELSAALGSLLAVADRYPQLQADTTFRELQAQLTGTENRIAVARNRYMRAVREYNAATHGFPANVTARVFGYAPKPNLTASSATAPDAATKLDAGARPTAADSSR